MEWIGIKVMRMKPDIYGGKVIKILLGDNSPLSGNSKSELFNGLINRERSEIEHRIGKTLVGIAAVEFAGALAGRALAFSGSWLKVLFKGATKGVAEAEKVSGSYLLEFQSGKFYAGKGLESRMMQSINRIETRYGDKLLKSTFYPASSTRAAFINEHKLMMQFGGPKSFNPLSPTYNKIFSPGKKLGGF